MHRLLLTFLIAFAQAAQASCIIDAGNKVVCDDYAKSSRSLDSQSSASDPNSRVETLSLKKGELAGEAPINLGKKTPVKKDKCRTTSDGMISLCGDEDDSKNAK